MSSAARTAARSASPITPAATAIARSARARRRRIGSRPARPICCRSAISTSSSRCRPTIAADRLPEQGGGLRPPVPRGGRRRCSRSPPIPSTSAPASALTAVLHTWGSAMTHHPHVHMIVPGGGISLDGTRWVPAGPAFSCRCGCCPACSGGCSWTALADAYAAGRLAFFGEHRGLASPPRPSPPTSRRSADELPSR